MRAGAVISRSFSMENTIFGFFGSFLKLGYGFEETSGFALAGGSDHQAIFLDFRSQAAMIR